MVIALFGENDFMVKQRKKTLIAEYLKKTGSDIGFEQFDSSVDAQKLWQSITAQPFMVETKMVVVNQPSENNELVEFLLDKTKEVPETTDLIIVEGKLDKRKSYYKQLKKLKGAEECNELDDPALTKWLITEAKEQGIDLTRPHAQKLVNRVGSDQWQLSNELKKLAAHTQITDQLIEDLTVASPQETIFNLLDALAEGQTKRAQELYDGLRKQQFDPHYVMSMLAWQMENILTVGYAGSRSEAEIAKQAKMNPYVVSKTKQLTRRLNKNGFKMAVDLLIQTDLKLKTSAGDADEVMKLLLLKLASVFG